MVKRIAGKRAVFDIRAGVIDLVRSDFVKETNFQPRLLLGYVEIFRASVLGSEPRLPATRSGIFIDCKEVVVAACLPLPSFLDIYPVG